MYTSPPRSAGQADQWNVAQQGAVRHDESFHPTEAFETKRCRSMAADATMNASGKLGRASGPRLGKENGPKLLAFTG